MRFISFAVWGLLVALGSAAIAQPRQIDTADLLDLPPADIYVLGEVHDNAIHHDNQAFAVTAIAPKAIVFEMLSEAQALAIRPELLGSEPDLRAALGWDATGWPDFAIYYPIFNAAKDALFYGAALDRALVRQAVSDGAAAVFGDGASLFGLDQVLDDNEQATREAGQMAAHCDALPVEMLGGMVEAQRLRDAALARATFAAFQETGGPVVVITGNGHARRDWGFPRDLEQVLPDPNILSIAQFESEPDNDTPFDLWLVTAPAEREDPCAAFKTK